MRIYYTSDLHGSEKCWRKFLATPKYYQADVIIIGGDITGKFIVPIIYLPNGRAEATFMGRKRKLKKQKVGKLKSNNMQMRVITKGAGLRVGTFFCATG